MEFAELILTPKVDQVVLHRPFNRRLEGTLCISGHHIILSSRKNHGEEIWLLHRNVDIVEKKVNVNGGVIVLKCKDFRVIQLDIPGVEECNNVALSIERLANLEDRRLHYPFFYRPDFQVLEDGWTAYSAESEFSKIIGQSEDWRISHVNKDYSVCESYPSIVVVPKSVEDSDLVGSAAFRQGGRFPILSYRHTNGACLLRASQPMPGPSGKRSRHDERLLNATITGERKGYVIETRAMSLVQAAKVRGGGSEMDAHYPQWKKINKSIDRHSSMLDSLAKFVEACNDTSCSMDKWMSRLDGSGWLTNVKESLNCACLAAQCLDQDQAMVLVHGGDGVASTLLVCSLCQIILNPDCRTVRGLEALVEREWLQAGYPFSSRHYKSAFAASKGVKTSVTAPTFILFLECVWQITQQFPTSFEFNDQFLICLFEHSYFTQFGTFMMDCEKERRDMCLADSTTSLWSYINHPEILSRYLNPLYEPNPRVLWPSVAPISLNLWRGMYLRWVSGKSEESDPERLVWKNVAELKEQENQLRSQVIKLRKQLGELEKDAISMGIMIDNSTTEATEN